jgi:hypothetical protein
MYESIVYKMESGRATRLWASRILAVRAGRTERPWPADDLTCDRLSVQVSLATSISISTLL